MSVLYSSILVTFVHESQLFFLTKGGSCLDLDLEVSVSGLGVRVSVSYLGTRMSRLGVQRLLTRVRNKT